jgi:hypothetical protein
MNFSESAHEGAAFFTVEHAVYFGSASRMQKFVLKVHTVILFVLPYFVAIAIRKCPSIT